MITFKEFLAESSYKQAIAVEEAIKLINTHCKDALKNKQPLFRGMRGTSDEALTVHGETGGRTSANTQNYYTVILDHFLPPLGYPKRSQSIILANSYDTARGFGRAYAIFPYDGVKIGVCDQSDLWYSPEFKVGNAEEEMRINTWNKVWDEYGLSPASYERFVESIKEKMEGGVSPSAANTARMLKDIFGSPDDVERILKKAYSPETLKLNLATTKDIDKYSDGEHELWIGGKCIAIDKRVWDKMKLDDHDDELAPEDDE